MVGGMVVNGRRDGREWSPGWRRARRAPLRPSPVTMLATALGLTGTERAAFMAAALGNPPASSPVSAAADPLRLPALQRLVVPPTPLVGPDRDVVEVARRLAPGGGQAAVRLVRCPRPTPADSSGEDASSRRLDGHRSRRAAAHAASQTASPEPPADRGRGARSRRHRQRQG